MICVDFMSDVSHEISGFYEYLNLEGNKVIILNFFIKFLSV